MERQSPTPADWQGEIQGRMQGDRLTELDTLADSADYALPGVVRSALRDAAAMLRNFPLAESHAELLSWAKEYHGAAILMGMGYGDKFDKMIARAERVRRDLEGER